MIKNIAMGRLNKFLKESCLLSQEYIWDKSMTVASYLQSIDKDLTITDFKRFTLRSE
jgi:elongation factor Ts